MKSNCGLRMGRECSDINYFGCGNQKEESQADHVRVYVPLDLSADAILRRLRFLVCRYMRTLHLSSTKSSILSNDARKSL